MGRSRNPSRQNLITQAVSDTAREFIKRYGGTLVREPFYRRLDRLIANYQIKDNRELIEKSERQAKVIAIYHKRIKELEEQLSNMTRPLEGYATMSKMQP